MPVMPLADFGRGEGVTGVGGVRDGTTKPTFRNGRGRHAISTPVC